MSYDCLVLGGRYRHVDGGYYTVTSDAEMKLPSGEWVDAVCYVSAQGGLYVRSRESFMERFVRAPTGSNIQ